MGIKFDSINKTFTASYTKRHPITRVPRSLRRKGIKSKAEAHRVYNEEKLKASEVPSWHKLVQ